MENLVTSTHFWKGRKVFVTGATGFIGSWLTQELCELGAEVTTTLRFPTREKSWFFLSDTYKRVNLVDSKLNNMENLGHILKGYNINTVFHLAALTQVTVADRVPFSTFESNVRVTYMLLEACRRAKVERVVVASSDKAYGVQDTLPYTEKHPLLGRGPYDVSKVCTDVIAQSYREYYGLPVLITRFGNVYGGGDLNWDRIVPGTIKYLLKNKRPFIRSNGLFQRDYIYVKDVVRAYLRCAEWIKEGRDTGTVLNFASGRPVTVLELVGCLQRIMSATHLEPEVLGGARNEIPDQYLDASEAKKILGWIPNYDLNQGLNETVKWYAQHAHEVGI